MILQLKKPNLNHQMFLPGSSIDIQGINLMSTFDNKPLNKGTIKYTTTRQCYTSKTVSSHSHISIP